MVSSIGASATPWRTRSLTAALTFWPAFRIAGSSKTGFRSASAAASGTWPATGSSKRPPEPETCAMGR